MYYLKSGISGSGFTNQIFNIITGILIAYIEGEKVVIVDKFITDINNEKYVPISEIIDLTVLNNCLKQIIDVIVIDKSKIDFEILYVKYGTKTIQQDLTEYIMQNYYYNNQLYISKDIIFNNIHGDPCPGIVKNIFLGYKINDYIIEEVYSENIQKDIIVDFDSHYNFPLGGIIFNNPLFEHILQTIQYNSEFIIKSNMILKEIDLNQKINVIHLRLEDDAIAHWSKQNNMSQYDYKVYIENKYIYLIQKYLSRTDNTIILSQSSSNGVIDFLNQANFTYKFIQKWFDDREKNAIIDLLISKCCNNIFIGNYNMSRLNGSTFSYYVSKSIKNNITRICIDLDNIHLDECISHRCDIKK